MKKWIFIFTVTLMGLIWMLITGLGVPQLGTLNPQTAIRVDGTLYAVENNILCSSIYSIDSDGILVLEYREPSKWGNRQILAVAGDSSGLYFIRRTVLQQDVQSVELMALDEKGKAQERGKLTLTDLRVTGLTAPSYLTTINVRRPHDVAVYDLTNGNPIVNIHPMDSRFAILARYIGEDTVAALMVNGETTRWSREGIQESGGKGILPAELPELFAMTLQTRIKCQSTYIVAFLVAIAAIALITLICVGTGYLRKIAGKAATRVAISTMLIIYLSGIVFLCVNFAASVSTFLDQTRRSAIGAADIIAEIGPEVLTGKTPTETKQYNVCYSLLSVYGADLLDTDLTVAVSSRLPEQIISEKIYSPCMKVLAQQALAGESGASLTQRYGQLLAAAASPVMINGTVVGLVVQYNPVEPIVMGQMLNLRILLITGAAGAVVMGLAAALWLLSFTHPLKQIAKQIARIAVGDTDVPIVPKNQGELSEMAQAMQEACLTISVKNYEMNSTVESYSRFVPRGLAQMLDRASIAEIGVGDISPRTGCVAVFSVCNALEARRNLNNTSFVGFVNECFQEIEKNLNEHEGFLLATGFRLSSLKLFYKNNAQAAVESGLTLLSYADAFSRRENERDPGFMLIYHYTSFLYGMAGTEKQVFPFLSSGEMEFLSEYTTKFYEIGVKMVATEEFFNCAVPYCNGRHIGYITDTAGGVTYRLFEILDSYTEFLRNKLIGYDDRFQEALELFYHRDFYMARSIFSVLLRECDGDGMARWYLFACESLFSSTDLPADDKLLQLFGVN